MLGMTAFKRRMTGASIHCGPDFRLSGCGWQAGGAAGVAGRALGWLQLAHQLAADGDADFLAPLADLLVADPEDAFVFPFGQRGRLGERVQVTGRGVVGQEHIAFAVAAIHLNFKHVQIGRVALPCPEHVHPGGNAGEGEHRQDRVEVRRRGRGADDAEFAGDGVGATAGFLDDLDDGEDAVERAGVHGRAAGRQGRRGERRQGAELGAVAGLGVGGGIGAGDREGADGTEPSLKDIDQPERIGKGGAGLRRRQAERGGIGGQFVAPVHQPIDLVGGSGWIIRVVLHTTPFGWGLVDWRGWRHIAGIARLQTDAGAAPTGIWVAKLGAIAIFDGFHVKIRGFGAFWGCRAAKWGAPPTVWSASLMIWGESSILWGDDSAVWGDAGMVWGAPPTVWGASLMIWGESSVLWGDDSAVWGDAGMVWGAPPTVWGTPQMKWGESSALWGDDSAVWGAPQMKRGDASAVWGASPGLWGDGSTIWGAPQMKWDAPQMLEEDAPAKWGAPHKAEEDAPTKWGAPQTISDAPPRREEDAAGKWGAPQMLEDDAAGTDATPPEKVADATGTDGDTPGKREAPREVRREAAKTERLPKLAEEVAAKSE